MSREQTIKILIQKFKGLKIDYYKFLELNEDFYGPYSGGLEPDYDNENVKEFFAKQSSYKKKLSSCITDIHKQSSVENHYFFDCPFIVYKETLDERLEWFLEHYTEASPLDFYKAELKHINEPGRNRILYVNNEKKIDYSGFIGANSHNFQFSLNKKIEYINTMIKNNSTESDLKIILKEDIFKNSKGKGLFVYLMEQFGISKETINENGVQSKLHSIFEVKDCNNFIFKPYTRLKKYIEFLNKEFGTEYNSRSLSDGSKHHNNIKVWKKQYLEI